MTTQVGRRHALPPAYRAVTDFLLEIGTEEIPSAIAQLEKLDLFGATPKVDAPPGRLVVRAVSVTERMAVVRSTGASVQRPTEPPCVSMRTGTHKGSPMSDFPLEIATEEIPSAIAQLEKLDLLGATPKVDATPRRLVVRAECLSVTERMAVLRPTGASMTSWGAVNARLNRHASACGQARTKEAR